MENNNKILILGGTSGVGLEVAKKFSEKDKVIVVGRNAEKGSHASLIENVNFLQSDISNDDERKKLIENLEKENINKVIHCAGIFQTNKTPEYEKEYEAVKKGGVEVVKELTKNDKLSHALAVSSLYTFLPEHESYDLERRVHKSLEDEMLNLNKDGLIVNCIAPGLIDTELARKGFGEKFDEILKDAPGSRILKPEEIAEAIHWLTNQDKIKNQVIPIDGGYLKNYKGKK